MKNLNRFQFIGNLTKDTELRYTAKSTPIAIFDIAVNGSYKEQESGEVKEYTDFFRIRPLSRYGVRLQKTLQSSWGKAHRSLLKVLCVTLSMNRTAKKCMALITLLRIFSI